MWVNRESENKNKSLSYPDLKSRLCPLQRPLLDFWVFVKVLGSLPVHHHRLHTGKLYVPSFPASFW